MSTTGSTTVGIDLASQPKGTAACVIEWDNAEGQVALLCDNLANRDLIELIHRTGVEKVGIDAPFGWPRGFVEAVTAYATLRRFPAIGWSQLAFRTTDRYVREITGQQPLSVSTNWIAYTAFRCAELLTELAGEDEPIDRRGGGLVVEVYPAAALRQWGLPYRGYKGANETSRRARAELARSVGKAATGWLGMNQSDALRLEESDHLLDALLAALVARASLAGHCLPVPQEHSAAAEVEGWIHVPYAGRLQPFQPV
jgi:predicted nuclease with RNAse H fold